MNHAVLLASKSHMPTALLFSQSARTNFSLRKCIWEKIRTVGTGNNPLQHLPDLPTSGLKENFSSPPSTEHSVHSPVEEKVKCLLNSTLEQRKQHKGALPHVLSQGYSKPLLPHSSDVSSLVLGSTVPHRYICYYSMGLLSLQI